MPAASVRRRIGVVAGAAALVVLLVACEDPPTTERVDVDHDCFIDSNNILVPDGSGQARSSFDTTAPQAVKPGGAFVVKLVPVPFSVDGTPTSSGTVAEVSNLVSKIDVPPGTNLVSYEISGWSNVGPGTPTVSSSGGVITVTTPGPIPSSTAASPYVATLPTLTLNLEATGAAGSYVDVTMAGTSTSSPGLTFKTKVTGTLVGTLNPTFACFPNPDEVLHRTLISNDTRAPVITIASPVQDAQVVQGSTVLADYTCSDGTGVGVATCSGTVPTGSAIDTATLGPKSFTVTTSDLEGKVAKKTVTYTVVAAA